MMADPGYPSRLRPLLGRCGKCWPVRAVAVENRNAPSSKADFLSSWIPLRGRAVKVQDDFGLGIDLFDLRIKEKVFRSLTLPDLPGRRG